MEERILKLFKENPDAYLSGEDISSKLNISRSGLWKHIEKLRSLGYEFDAVPHLGYKLNRVPDRLYPQEIGFKLDTKRIGRNIVYYDSIGSTNTEAYSLAMAGAEEGTVVVAERQEKGRGRLSREWASPKEKGIYMSIVLKPKITPFQAPKITLMAAVSSALAIRDTTGAPALIKWPNDILLGDKKIGGILTEMDAEPDTINFLVLGIGINVNSKQSELPKGAGSISHATGSNVSRVALVRALLGKLEAHYSNFNKDGFSFIRQQWCNLSATLGRRVRATCMHKRIEGEAADLDADGALKIRLDNGFYERVLAGDLLLLR